MRIAGYKPTSLIDGDGIRFVLFTQGCVHQCDGCHNPDTWDINGGVEESVENLANIISMHKHIDGVTLSGGEPFLQQDECVKLLKLLPSHLNVWVYTGFKYEDIQYAELASLVNVIVDGKFEKDKVVEDKPYGSSNQRVIRLR